MEHGTRVTRRSTGDTGMVVGKIMDDRAYVKWEAGGGGSVPLEDLAPADKSWPPAGMETKTPSVEHK